MPSYCPNLGQGLVNGYKDNKVATGKPVVALLRELLSECGPGPSRRREILNIAIETIEGQWLQIRSQQDTIAILKQQVEMWHQVAEDRSAEIYKLLKHHKRGEP